jgi:cobalt-zinc-cadmium efflux system membrane fusion protein
MVDLSPAPRQFRIRRTVLAVVAIALVALIATVVAHFGSVGSDVARDASSVEAISLGATADTLCLAPELRDRLQLQVAKVEPAPALAPLRLPGSLFLDSSRLVRVRSRFDGEVVSIGAMEERTPYDNRTASRQLRFGDRVAKDQLLAVIWSKEVGEKKSELLDAYSRLRASELELKRLQSLQPGTVAERSIREAMRNHEADLIAVDRLELTLRSWRIGEADIAKVKAEADQLIQSGQRPDDVAEERRWAEVAVRAPFAGVIVEKNVTVGDLANQHLVLFKIADLSRIGVIAHAYEEDLPKLARLEPGERNWRIRLKAEPDTHPIEGQFEVVGNFIDPNQHSGAVVGWIDNQEGRLFVGQFITAEIELPPAADEVAVPTSAVVEDGQSSTLFVAAEADLAQLARRKVAVIRRSSGMVHVRATPTQREREAGCEELRPGELVVTSGTIELAAALETLQAAKSAGRDRVK